MDEGEGGNGEPLRFDSTLRLRRFVGVSLKNALLNLITLTLYRFWGKTEVRRRVWEGIRLNGEPFEYTGRGMELFVGFLLAAALVGAPFLVLVFAAQFLHPLVAGPLLLLAYLGVFFLVGFGSFTAFRYAASRTRWRGVRFRLRGKASEYGLYFVLLTFAKGLSLGWATPAADLFLAERLWGGLTFGDRPLRWSRARVVNLYGRFALGWFAVALGYVALIVGVVAIVLAAGVDTETEPSAELILGLYGFGLVLALIIAAAFTPYRAGLLREVAASLRLDEAQFRLDLRSPALLKLTLTNLLLIVVTLGFAMPIVQARTVRFMIGRLSAEGSADLAQARQTASAGPAHGEGLADAFGLSPI